MLDVAAQRGDGTTAEERELTAERGPVRTCVGCRERDGKDALVRLAIVPAELRVGGAAVVVDVARKAPGRGLHVHPTRACVAAAVERGGIAKAVRGAPGVTAAALADALRAKLFERVAGILGGARRARKLAIGTDAVTASSGAASALVVATDAAGKSGELAASATNRGIPVVRFLDKMGLGALTRPRGGGAHGGGVGDETAAQPPEVGVVAILDAGIAAEVVRALGRASQLSEA